jgi:predicted RNA-binding protein
VGVVCQSNIVKISNKKEVSIAQDIDFIKVISKGKLLIRTVLGREAYIEGDIQEIDLRGHRVLLK